MSATGGGTNLSELLRTMEPELRTGEYIFATVTPEKFATLNMATIDCFFRENATEITIILTLDAALAAGLQATAPFSWITLTVHSSLEAVGLTAAFATALGAANISCNVVAAYYHDHIFVPSRDGTRAIQVLRDLAIANGASQ